jgi:hypothetical protein
MKRDRIGCDSGWLVSDRNKALPLHAKRAMIKV